MKIKLLQVKEATGTKVSQPSVVAKEMQAEAKADRECFWVLHLNTQNRIIEKELAHMGVLNSCQVHLRETFRKAVINSTRAIITVHNHPSGEIKPSPEDIKLWDRLRQAGKILGIEILDNLIITPRGSYYSEKINN